MYIGFQAAIVVVHLETGEVKPLHALGATQLSYALRDHCDGVLIAVRSSFTTAPRVVMRHVDSDKDWIALPDAFQPQVEPSVEDALKQLEQVEIKFKPEGDDASSVECDAVLVRRADKTGTCCFLNQMESDDGRV